jgi:peptidoglycan/xylan/chitin deacetylase (PgdA/CDA1 family)
MFVPTAFIGASNRFDEAEPEEPICDWDDLRELESCGVSIQSHGVGHRGLSALRPDELREELVRSRAVLEGRLARPVEVFAYPYGDGGADPGVVGESLWQAGYRAALLYGGGPNRWPAADPYRLTRLAMGPDTDLGEALAATGAGEVGDPG